MGSEGRERKREKSGRRVGRRGRQTEKNVMDFGSNECRVVLFQF